MSAGEKTPKEEAEERKAAEKRAARRAETRSVRSTGGRLELEELDRKLDAAEKTKDPNEITAATLERERARDRARVFDAEEMRRYEKDMEQMRKIRRRNEPREH